VARGGHRWLVVVEEELGVLEEGLGEEKEKEDGCFTLLDVFEACNTRQGELIHNSNFLLR